MTSVEESRGPLELVLVRHGQSTWNEARLVQGQNDVASLTSLGQRQALAAARSLALTPIDAIFSSDLSRAHETASIIASELHVPVHTTTHLRERAFGNMEGVPLAELMSELSGIDHGRVVNASAHPIGGESLDELLERTGQYLDELATVHRGGRVVLVTHGGTIRALRANVERRTMLGLEWYPVKNCSIWHVDVPHGELNNSPG